MADEKSAAEVKPAAEQKVARVESNQQEIAKQLQHLRSEIAEKNQQLQEIQELFAERDMAGMTSASENFRENKEKYKAVQDLKSKLKPVIEGIDEWNRVARDSNKTKEERGVALQNIVKHKDMIKQVEEDKMWLSQLESEYEEAMAKYEMEATTISDGMATMVILEDDIEKLMKQCKTLELQMSKAKPDNRAQQYGSALLSSGVTIGNAEGKTAATDHVNPNLAQLKGQVKSDL